MYGVDERREERIWEARSEDVIGEVIEEIAEEMWKTFCWRLSKRAHHDHRHDVYGIHTTRGSSSY